MAHGLADQHFRSYEEVKNWIDLWIASKDDQFFRRGIHMLLERWEKVMASDGQYFEYNQFFIIKPRISEKRRKQSCTPNIMIDFVPVHRNVHTIGHQKICNNFSSMARSEKIFLLRFLFRFVCFPVRHRIKNNL